MKKGLAILLVFLMSMGTMAAALNSVPTAYMSEGDSSIGPSDVPVNDPLHPAQPPLDLGGDPILVTGDEVDPIEDYIAGLDPDGPRPPLKPLPGGDTIIKTFVDCIMMYQDPRDEDNWLPLPETGMTTTSKVSFQNGTQHEIHGKLFETIVEENTTYFDDIGIAQQPITVLFDGEPIAHPPQTYNNTTVLDPFSEHGNGTFDLLLDINKPAGQYEIELVYESTSQYYEPLRYKAIVWVNHPIEITLTIEPDAQDVGKPIQIVGNLADDTGVPIPYVDLQVRFDNVLLGPTSDGVYIDDVHVSGEEFFDDFEAEEDLGWSTYTHPGRGVGNQWMRGSPSEGVGPSAPHSGSRLFGTILNGDYQRGAYSFLVTPKLNFTQEQDYILSFYTWWSVYWQQDYCYILASLDGGATWDEENQMDFMATLIQDEWTYYEFNVSRYVGSDQVMFAFVFISADKTLEVRGDSTFSYQFVIPMSTTANFHRMSVHFKGNEKFRAGMDYEDVRIRRITHFDFETNASKKVGHRNNPVKLVAWLRDNMGEVPSTNIGSIPYIYQVAIFWDKTWTDDTDQPDPAGPPRTMDRDSGEVSVNYVITWNQTLGPANVTFKFPGDDFYTAVIDSTIYYTKAQVYVKLPEKEKLRGYRGLNLNINGELRILPDQSIDDQQSGDAVSGEFISILWENERIGNRRTQFDGSFEVDYLIPATDPLGDVLVTFKYDGQSLYEETTEYANYTIVSETFITLEAQKVFKGTWVFINGTIKDDKDQPVANMPVYIIWKRAPEIGRATSKTDGTFSLQHFVPFEDKVGNISVIARFKGTKIYLANETTSEFTVKVHTRLEKQSVNAVFIRGEQVQVSGRLYEDWDGKTIQRVQREYINLFIDDILASTKKTSFEGDVSFTAAIDPKIFRYGEVSLVLDFNGTDFYEPSRNTTLVVIKANSVLTFTEIRITGEIIESLANLDDPDKRKEVGGELYQPGWVVLKGSEVYGRILLQDDNYQPIPHGNVTVYYKEEGRHATKRLVETGTSDALGYFEFNITIKVPIDGNKTFIVEYDGLEMDTENKAGDLIILPTDAIYNVSYAVPPPPEFVVPWWVYVVVGVVIAVASVGIVWSSFYYRKRRQLKRMQRIIRRAADRLVAGNVYAATIFRAYREMANTLRAYGQLRRDSETFREFENAVREALPIDEDNLDAFLTVLEEARYSEHEIGEGEKDTAIGALRGVQNSIEKILITDEQAARIKERVSEIGDMVEPDIIVAEEGKKPPVAKPPEAAKAAAEPAPEKPSSEEGQKPED